MKRFFALLLCAAMLLPITAHAQDEQSAYCTVTYGDALTAEVGTTGIYDIDCSSGEAGNVTFRCVYDEKIIKAEVFSDENGARLYIDGVRKGETQLEIEMLSESGDVLASDTVDVTVSAYPAGDIFRSVLETAEYYIILFFCHILPDLAAIPFNYLRDAIGGLIK